MQAYDSWNTAITQYFTANVPKGSSVFLTLNDDALRDIAAEFIGGAVSPHNASAEFVNSVRARVVSANAVSLLEVIGFSKDGIPKGAAFLGLMVLAAHRMAGDDVMSPLNYFSRLTQLLGVGQGNGNRPSGLDVGNEEVLWLCWNVWLEKNGWQPTARAAEGARKYLNYVLTQALIRDDDSLYLQRRFRENQGYGGVGRSMDEVQLAGWLQRTHAITRRYLCEGFRNSDPRRAAAFYEAAYRVYSATDWDGVNNQTAVQRSRVINAGLYRAVSLRGEVHFRLFVPQPTNWIPKALQMTNPDGGKVQLLPGRPGHFQPLARQLPFVAEPVRIPLEGDPNFEAVVFPSRNFWILTSDLEDPTGAFATWEKFPNLLGQKFTLLCSIEGDQCIQDEMDKFKENKLINWDTAESVAANSAHEYRGCMILSSAWDGVVPSAQCPDLYEALKPRQFANISIAGGFRAPEQNAWLVGYPPNVTIYGFEQQFGLTLLSGGEKVFNVSQERQKRLLLDASLQPGIYTLEADWNGQVLAARSFRVIPWEDMPLAEEDASIVVETCFSGKKICTSGALLKEVNHV